MQSIENIHFRRGQPVRSADLNTIVAAVRQSLGLGDGFDSGDGFGVYQKNKARSFDLWASTTEELAPNSVFTILDSLAWSDPPKISLTSVADDNKLGLFTNGDILIPADCLASVRPIGFERVTRLRYTGAAPTPGLECGPDLTTPYVISQDGEGLLCLSEPDPTDTWVWVIRVASAISKEGWGVLVTTLNSQSTAFVDMITDDGTAYTGETIGVTDTALNTDESIPSGTKIYVKKKGEIYIWLNARCVISDTLPA